MIGTFLYRCRNGSSSLVTTASTRLSVSSCSPFPSRTNATSVSAAAIRGFATRTGTVKFYMLDKGYGFIAPDPVSSGMPAGPDVFVHRSSIRSDLPTESFLRNPYLRRGEKVRFETMPDAPGGLEKAVNVTWLDGKLIPPLRANYLGNAHEKAKYELGQRVFAALTDPGITEEEKMAKVRSSFEYSLSIIRSAEAFITKVGMKIDDFPLVKATGGKRKGYYQHDDGDGDSVNDRDTESSQAERDSKN